MRVGLYSGTFDPIHKGHVAFAVQAAQQCRLDRIIFLPEPAPRGKVGVTAVADRAVQIMQAIVEHSAFEVWQLEQPSFTIATTMPVLRQKLGDAELTLLLGSDVARGLPNWPDSASLLENTALAIGMRGADSEQALAEQLQQIPLAGKLHATYVYTDYPHLSSSQVREKRSLPK